MHADRNIKVIIPAKVELIGQPGDVVLTAKSDRLSFRFAESDLQGSGDVSAEVFELFTRRVQGFGFTKMLLGQAKREHPRFNRIEMKVALVGRIVWVD